MKIILASKSPRRKEILQKHGLEPIIMPADTDETLPDGIGMTEAVEMLAERKAQACCEKILADPELRSRFSVCECGNSRHETTSPETGKYLIIGSDTIVWKDEIMGKPADQDDAFRMLDKLRGTHHYVVTGVAVIDPASGSRTVFSDITTVHFKNYTDKDILDYISREEPYDKAGSYAIQGYFGRYIDHIEGDYENVVGFPYYRLEAIIKKHEQ
jgi:septum formation protein